MPATPLARPLTGVGTPGTEAPCVLHSKKLFRLRIFGWLFSSIAAYMEAKFDPIPLSILLAAILLYA
jgi:hypothetical protein